MYDDDGLIIPEEPWWTPSYPENWYPQEWYPEEPWYPQQPEWQIKTELQFTCPYCGKLITIRWYYPGYYEVYFCPHCGKGIREKEKKCCNIQLVASWNYCPICGKKVEK